MTSTRLSAAPTRLSAAPDGLAAAREARRLEYRARRIQFAIGELRRLTAARPQGGTTPPAVVEPVIAEWSEELRDVKRRLAEL